MNIKRISIVAAALTALIAPLAVVQASSQAATPITFAYAGDSITARSDSWWYVMQNDARFKSVGGYGKSGYRTDQVLDNIKPVAGADVLVLELGTNDVNQQVPSATILANMQKIIDKVGATRVLIVALPPSNVTSGGGWGTDRNKAAILFNRELAVWAGYRGYVYFDPFIVYREADGTWTPGSDADGVHPTAEANQTIERWFGWGIQQANVASKP